MKVKLMYKQLQSTPMYAFLWSKGETACGCAYAEVLMHFHCWQRNQHKTKCQRYKEDIRDIYKEDITTSDP